MDLSSKSLNKALIRSHNSLWVWLFCIFPYDDPVVAILSIRLLRVYLIILRWPVFLVDNFEFVVAGTESSA